MGQSALANFIPIERINAHVGFVCNPINSAGKEIIWAIDYINVVKRGQNKRALDFILLFHSHLNSYGRHWKLQSTC